MVQPLIVRPLDDGRYELIAGERRWRAATSTPGIETVPALIRDEDEIQRMQIALIENVAREDLNPVEEARACAALVERAGRLEGGAGPPAGAQPGRDLQPDPPARPARRGARLLLEDGRSPRATAARSCRLTATTGARKLARAAAAGGWSVRETERRAKAGATPAGRRPAAAPDQVEALREAEERLESALGTGVVVRGHPQRRPRRAAFRRPRRAAGLRPPQRLGSSHAPGDCWR